MKRVFASGPRVSQQGKTLVPELRAGAERAAQESGNAGIKPWAGPSALRGTWLFSALFGIPTLLRSWPPRDDIPATI
jgi:hypothetical protein